MMENNFDNKPEESGQTSSQPVYTDPNADTEQSSSRPVYTDPNADVKEDAAENATAYQYTQSDTGNSYAGYQQNTPNQSGQSGYQYQNPQNQSGQSSNYQYQNSQNSNSQYQDNLNYNIGNNMGYNQNSYQDMDTSPMSMGDWLLTILAAMIPCAGLILYLVWAFSSTGNVNRRNFCRAQLIIMAVVFVLYLVIAVVFGVAFMSSGTSLY